MTGAQRVARYRQRKREAGLSLTWSPASATAAAAVDGRARDVRDPPAARGQPKRDGPDFWPTPACLITALVRYVLPELPPGSIWDCAAGDGRLVRAMAEAGRTVVGTNRYPQDGNAPHDFLTDPPPWADTVIVTNPPGNQIDKFLARCTELFDQGAVKGFVLLLRNDHLMARGRVDALNRAAREIHCNWRPRWVPGTRGNPRWAYRWVVWHGGPSRPPLYLAEAEIEETQEQPARPGRRRRGHE